MATLKDTNLFYLDDSFRFEDAAKVLGLQDTETGDKVIFLDQTIFHPQGGGQPYDTGYIKTSKAVFEVNEVRFIEGVVHHIGIFTEGNFAAGDDVQLIIDQSRRVHNCKIHSAGHVVDVAMSNIGFRFPPNKGYHFPDSPYVEYIGIIPPEEREAVRTKLEAETNELITKGGEVTTQIVEQREDLSDLCDFVPDYIPEDKPIRVVTVAQNIGCPCGGTHVRNINEIGELTIRKIKVKNGKTRVSYQIA